MIEKWFEPFTLLEETPTPDGLGSRTAAFTPALSFLGALTWAEDQPHPAAASQALRCAPALLHEFDVTLSPGDHVRRDKDGAVYRVTGRSDSLRSPALSGLRFAQVPLERVVVPC